MNVLPGDVDRSPSRRSGTVGRESELRRLAGLLAEVSEGRGKTCFITGEAGSGKSTLVAEFVQRSLDSREDVVVAIGSCDAHVGIGDPYLPFLDVVSELTGTVDAKAQAKLPSAAVARLRGIAGVSAEVLLEVAPDLLGTLIPGASLVAKAIALAAQKAGIVDGLKNTQPTEPSARPRIDQDQIFKSYENLLRELSRQQPVIVILDDLHWADASSCALLRHLARAMSNSPILLVGTYRPNDIELASGDGRHPMASAINELKRYLGDIFIDLDKHDEARRRAFVRELIDLEPNDISDEWCAALFSHTRGHPLFTIELLHALRERGVLENTDQGWVAAKGTLWNILPTRVEGVIEERIGRLDGELRDILRLGSVEGESFTAEIIARILELPEQKLLRLLMDQLIERHRLVVEGDVRRVGRAFLSQFAFNHALFQQYFYEHLGRRERMLWHAQIAESLEALHQGRTEDVAAQLARHFVAAGNAEKAFDYLMKTAERAMRLSAYNEVLAQTATALEMVELLESDRESRELDVLLTRAAALQALLGWAAKETTETIARARELASKVPPNERMVPLLFGRFAGLITQGRYVEAHAVARELEEGNYGDVANGGLTASLTVGVSAFWLGRMVESRHALMKGLDHPSATGGQLDGNRLRVFLLRQLVLNEFLLGDEAASRRYLAEMVAFADTSADPFVICASHSGVAWDAYHRRDPEAVRLTMERAREAEKFPFYKDLLLVFRIWAEGMSGDAEAIVRLATAFAGLSNGGSYFHSIHAAMTTELLRLHGQPDQALACVDAGIARTLEVQDLVYLSELHRHRADVLHDLGRDEEAIGACQKALDVAGQDLVVFAMRARASLTRLSCH